MNVASRMTVFKRGTHMQQQPLWFWGFLFILGAAFANMAMGMIMPTTNRAEMLGRGIGTVLMGVIGVILIIAHFVRRKN
jgi:hypothetical protein